MKILNQQEKESQTTFVKIHNKHNELASLKKELEVEKAGREGRWPDDYFAWVKDNWTSRGEKLDFVEHKYLEAIYKDQSPYICVMKAAQVGITERGLTEAIWLPDMYQENALYVFPTSNAVSDLVQERIDEPLNNNAYLRRVSGRAKRIMGKQADKVGLKRMSKGFVYFRGSNKATQITSVPADAVFIDEVDLMVQENVPYIEKRLGHSNRKWQRWFSTPTIPSFGIHKMFMETDRRHYHITCGNCGHKDKLEFHTNVKYEMKNDTECEWAKLVCGKCDEEIIPWELEGEWIAEKPEVEKHGYFVSKLYSPRTDFVKMVEASLKTSESEIQQFHNQDLGLPYEPKGARITDEIMQSCKRDHRLGVVKDVDVFMGVDVGKYLHVIIMTDKQIIGIEKVKDFEDLDKRMDDYNIKQCVVDALPETRKAQEFADRYVGRVRLCWYTGLKEPKEGEWFQAKEGEQKVNTDRTLSLDMYSDRYKKQDVELPTTLDDHTEFKNNMMALTRTVVQKKNGNMVAEYVHTDPDHYYHAGNYCNIAKGIFHNVDVPDIMSF